MRKSITLLFTIIVLITVSAILSSSISHFKKYVKEESDFETELKAMNANMELFSLLKSRLNEIKDSNRLSAVSSAVFSTAINGFDIEFSVKPASCGINPNSMWKADSKNDKIFNKGNAEVTFLMKEILLESGVADPDLFMDMMLDTMDEDLESRGAGTEIALEDKSFPNGSIRNMEHFFKILKHYKDATGDGSVYSIPWKKILSFSSEKADINCASEELLKYIAKNTEDILMENIHERTYSSLEEIPFRDEEKERLKKLGFSTFTPVIRVSIRSAGKNIAVETVFIYDTSLRKVKKVVFSKQKIQSGNSG